MYIWREGGYIHVGQATGENTGGGQGRGVSGGGSGILGNLKVNCSW